MMSARAGVTLMEIIIVIMILSVAAAMGLPNYLASTEQTRASNARSNLLAIYSAEQNYNNNNNNSYCLSTANTATAACNTLLSDNKCADSLAAINCNLSLQIQDDGTYTYSCSGTTCTATRAANANTHIVLTLSSAINISGNVNPQCSTTSNWCPP
jgi:prepilin-type N-terminal cleavage/methylation domain-containing protein